MVPVAGVSPSTEVSLLGAVPGQSLDPSIIIDTPVLRAVSSFLLVLLFGSAVLIRYRGLVERSVEASMNNPFVSVVYGVGTHLVIAFAGGVFSTQLANAGVDRTLLQVVGTATFAAAMLVLAGLGFAILGTSLTERRGERDPWRGLVVFAAVSAIVWLVAPLLVGAAVWVLLVSAGIGGPARRWVHAEAG